MKIYGIALAADTEALKKYADEFGNLEVVLDGIISPADREVGIMGPYVEDLTVAVGTEDITHLLTEKQIDRLSEKFMESVQEKSQGEYQKE